MSEVAPRTVGEVEVYRQMAGTVHNVVARCAEGISQEESLIQPGAHGNCMNWILGHLIRVYDNLLPLVGQKPLGGFERFSRGAAPLKDGADAMDIRKLLEAWDESARRFDDGLATLTEKQLDEAAPFSASGSPKETVRSLLSMMMFHQSYHAGQMALLRRVAGKDRVQG